MGSVGKVCGCGVVVTDGPARCATCRQRAARVRDARRDPVRRRLMYGQAHRVVRRQWQRKLERGMIHRCPKCTVIISKYDTWDLGHQANGAPSVPEHATCNRAAGGRVPIAARGSQVTPLPPKLSESVRAQEAGE